MKLENIKHSAERLNTLIEGWKNSGSVPRIERDLALDELRKIYDQLLDVEVDKYVEATPIASVVAAPVVAVAQEPVNAVDAQDSDEERTKVEESHEEVDAAADEDILDIDALLGLSAPVAAAVATTETAASEMPDELAPTIEEKAAEAPVVAEPTVAAEPEVTPELEPEVNRATVADASATSGALFAMEDIPVAKRGGRTMISLYNTAGRTATPVAATDDDDDEPTTVPIVESEPQPKRLGDVLGGDKQVLAEKIASEEKPTTPFNRITDLRKAIGLNDKFLMIKDLFGGNAALYEATIDTLNEFDDLDDCMIYIVENFSWNPDSEGAKLLVSLIERKLS